MRFALLEMRRPFFCFILKYPLLLFGAPQGIIDKKAKREGYAVADEERLFVGEADLAGKGSRLPPGGFVQYPAGRVDNG